MKKNIRKKTTIINKGTLDQKHTEKLTFFEQQTESLPDKRQRLAIYENELSQINKIEPHKYTHNITRRKSQLMDLIYYLRNDISSIEKCKANMNYLDKNLHLLIDYYDNKNVVDYIDDDDDDYYNTSNNGKTDIMKFLSQAQLTKKTSSDPNVKTISRAKIYDDYLEINDLYTKKNTNKNTKCDFSGCDGEKILSHAEGCLVCTKCGRIEEILLTTEKINCKEQMQDGNSYAYKRINHLTEILSQLQAKESTDVPNDIFDSIYQEIKKRKIDKFDLDVFKLRKILKKLKFYKYYEHVPHILQVINGKKPPCFSRKDEAKIKEMFRDIQKPFAIYCPKERKNFLNYSYVLHKFCELLELDDFITYFPLLKNPNKLLQHDKIWRNICKYMKWEYHKSI